MPLPLDGPHAKSMSRLSTRIRFHRAGSRRSLSTCRHTFWPVASTSFSSRLLTAPRPRSRKRTAYSFGIERFSARRATTKPPPSLKLKSICSARTRPADTIDSLSSAVPEAVGSQSDIIAGSASFFRVILWSARVRSAKPVECHAHKHRPSHILFLQITLIIYYTILFLLLF